MRIYEHKNGYSAALYGTSYMNVYYKGRRVLRTNKREVNTETEVMNFLDNAPMLITRPFPATFNAITDQIKKRGDAMTPMEAWKIITRNLKQLYATRDSLGITPYTEEEIEAEVMCFTALKEAQRREDDCK